MHNDCDEQYIDTGYNMQISSEFITSDLIQEYATLRSFPIGQRNCYTLTPPNGKENKYLIRTHFMYGNYDGKNEIPVFDVYIGVNFWFRVSLNSVYHKLFSEIIHVPKEEFICVCLVNIRQGTPFISALFLRPLNNSIYECDSGSLMISTRYWTGSVANILSYHSFPDDPFDREWAAVPSASNTWKFSSTNVDVNLKQNNAYQVPPSILRTAATPESKNGTLSFFSNVSDLNAVVYVYWHFVEIEKLRPKESREFIISTNGNFRSGPITPKYLEADTIASSAIPLQGLQFSFSMNKTNASTRPPMLNALEIYTLVKLPQSPTNPQDVSAITDVKAKLKVKKIWQGDPCLPVCPWNGLDCTSNDTASPRITSLNLASRGLTGNIPLSLSNLASLNYLNLSHNNLTGGVPEFLAQMRSLRTLDLNENKLTGTVPAALTDKANKRLLSLSLEGNPNLCTTSSKCEKSKKVNILVPVTVSVSVAMVILLVAMFFILKWKRRGSAKWIKNEQGMKEEKQKYTYAEVVSMTNNFEKEIGRGGFGRVYMGSLPDGTTIAVKILNPSSSISLKLFRTEAQLLTRVHHRNLVSLIGYCEDGMVMALIYEFMPNGNLQEHLSDKNPNAMGWKERLQIAIDVAQGLQYLHRGCKPSIVHRDMKTANILLDEKMQAKIADFGLSRIFSSESETHFSTDVAGTKGYLDPEYNRTGRLTEKSDVYSFGMVLLELITTRPVIMTSIHIVEWVTPLLDRGDIHSIVDHRLHRLYSVNSSWRTLEIAMACVLANAVQRPSMTQVLTDLNECLELELAHEKSTNGRSSEIVNPITLDTDMMVGPSSR